ncbi:MAG TPA: SprT-like domain-containing protein [Thermodesulfovibrionales bacterium]|jgi:hypothetical protein|nr:SprT-like domain-containing protein [Thermodesulfovibrionales bacterium]
MSSALMREEKDHEGPPPEGYSPSRSTTLKRPEQLALSLAYDPYYLGRLFERVAGSRVSLTIIDTSSSLISIRERDDMLFVRLHRIFLSSGSDVIDEIASFIGRRKGATPLVRKFAEQNSSYLAMGRLRIKTKSLGKYHDLDEIYRSLNAEYFGERISCVITWGSKNAPGAVKRRTLGSYSRHTNTIRINPVLDRKEVPASLIRFVVYHEMLHADMDIVRINGRRLVHSKEFRTREKAFRDYDEALAWERGREPAVKPIDAPDRCTPRFSSIMNV